MTDRQRQQHAASAAAMASASVSNAAPRVSTSAEAQNHLVHVPHSSPRVVATAAAKLLSRSSLHDESSSLTRRKSPRRDGTSPTTNSAVLGNGTIAREGSTSPPLTVTGAAGSNHNATTINNATAATGSSSDGSTSVVDPSPAATVNGKELHRVLASNAVESPKKAKSKQHQPLGRSESDNSGGSSRASMTSTDSPEAGTSVGLVRSTSQVTVAGASVVTEPIAEFVAGTAAAMNNSKLCANCQHAFSLFELRHTCKLCRRRLCDLCSKNRIKLNRRLERKKGSRLCDRCAHQYLQTHTSDGTALPTESVQVAAAAGQMVTTAAPMMPPLARQETTHFETIEQEPEEPNSSSRLYSVESAASLRSTDGVTGISRPTSASPSSHLRARHWVAFWFWGILIVLRLWFIEGHHHQKGDFPQSAWRRLLCRQLEQLVTIRFFGFFFLVLIAVDEANVLVKHSIRRAATTASPLITAAEAAAPKSRRHSAAVITSKRPSFRGRSPSTSSTGVAVRSAGRRHRTRSRLSSSSHIQQPEVLEVDTSENISREDSQGFHIDKLTLALHKCFDASGSSKKPSGAAMEMGDFLVACESICLFVLVFGRATSFAASTVQGYMDSIRNNLSAWPLAELELAGRSKGVGKEPSEVSATWLNASVRQVIEREVALGTAAVGGKKKPSCTRCVLRLLWFVEFVEACMRYTLVENVEEDCVAGATKAYEETIGSRHAWIIRKGVTSALSTMPKRRAILSALRLGPPCDDQHAMDQVQQVNTLMQELVDQVTNVLKEHQLLDVK